MPAKSTAAEQTTLRALARCVGLPWTGDAGPIQRASREARSLDLSGLPITDLRPLASLTGLRLEVPSDIPDIPGEVEVAGRAVDGA